MSNQRELLTKLKEKTKENIKSLLDKEMIYSDDKLQKNYIQNHSLEYSSSSTKKPIPINVIYHSLYDQDNLCQSSNGKLNYNRHNLSVRNDYDIKYDKKTFDNDETPKYFKMPIDKCVKSVMENKSIVDEIDDLDNYPKIFEFQYQYQHPIPNPIMFGPKLLHNTDNYKIIFISPICLIVDQKSDSTGFAGIDCFYTSMRYKYDMELNDDLTIKQTIFNCYFGVNFIKSSWLQSKITSNAFGQAEEGFTKKFLPAVTKELNLTIKKFSASSNNRVVKINKNDKSILEDLIINDSFISDSEDEKEKKKAKNEGADESNLFSKKNVLNIVLIIISIIAGLYLLKFLGRENIILILLSLIVYNLFLVNRKLDKLCNSKKI